MFPRILTLIRQHLQQRQVRQSLGRILARDDDHLLDDMGITRADAESMMSHTPATDPFHTQVRLTPDAAAAAGFSRWAISGSSRPM